MYMWRKYEKIFFENNEQMALKVTNFIASLESKLTDVIEDFEWSDEKEKQLLSYLNAIKSTFMMQINLVRAFLLLQ